VARLILSRNGQTVSDTPLAAERLRVGRGPECDIPLADPTKTVSRLHAEVFAEGTGHVIVDLGSENGTWVDGRRVDRVALLAGVSVSIGPYVLTCVDHHTDATVYRPLPPRQQRPAHERKGVIRWRELSRSVPRVPVVVGLIACLGLTGVLMRTPVLETDTAVATGHEAAAALADTRLVAARDAAGAGRWDDALREASALLQVRPDSGDGARIAFAALMHRLVDLPPLDEQLAVLNHAATSRPEPAVASTADADRARLERAKQAFTAQRLQDARTALDRGEYITALHLLESVGREAPSPDLDALVTRARELQASAAAAAAQSAYHAGVRLEQQLDLPAALQQYERAAMLEFDAPDLQPAIRRVRNMMVTRGEEELRRARLYDARSRVSEAVLHYEAARKLLPESHPGYQVAGDRLAALRARP
jgi:tetratricopeptide (TPR) repeat protein